MHAELEGPRQTDVSQERRLDDPCISTCCPQDSSKASFDYLAKYEWQGLTKMSCSLNLKLSLNKVPLLTSIPPHKLTTAPTSVPAAAWHKRWPAKASLRSTFYEFDLKSVFVSCTPSSPRFFLFNLPPYIVVTAGASSKERPALKLVYHRK